MRVFKKACLQFLFAAALVLYGCGPEQKLQTSEKPAAEAAERTDPRMADRILRDQDGKEVKLYSDLLKGKIVVITFFFTTCTTVCDQQGKHFIKLQDALGPRQGNEVNLISLTKDPTNDTPEVLKEWAAKYNVHTGWTLLTGDFEEVKQTFISFTGQGPSIMEHAPIILVGNIDKGKWFRLNGLTPIDELEQYIEKVK